MKIEAISPDEWVMSGGGAQCHSYCKKTDDSVMLKLFAPHLPLSLVEEEFTISHNVYDAGLPCVKPISIVTDGTRYGIVIPKIKDKCSFCTAVSRDPECLDDMARRMSGIGCLLHTTSADKTRFKSVLDIYRELFNASKSDDSAFMEACDRILLDMEANDHSCTYLHGDFHFGNMITDGKRDYMIDLGAFSYGNPLFDLSLFYLVTHLLPPGFIQDIYHITQEQAQDFWDTFKFYYYNGMQIPVPSDESLMKQIAPFLLIRTLSFERDMGVDEHLLNYRCRFLDALTF